MNILNQPLTIEEIKKQADEKHFIEGIVPVSLSDIINKDFNEFLDLISEKLVGEPTLMEVNYRVAGHQDEFTVLIKVSGYATQIIEEAD